MDNEKIKKLFPLSAKYDEKWVRENSYDGLTLMCLESLLKIMDLKPSMRVLDLGCGRAISSIFLAKELGVSVWAVDINISATENYKRAAESGCGDTVFPLKSDARHFPFPKEYFDAVVSIDAYSYFGMDERYLGYLVSFLKPGGRIGILDGCFKNEFETPQEVPEHIIPVYYDEEDPWYPVHSPMWWKNFWEKTGKVKVIKTELVPETEIIWEKYFENCSAIESEKKLIEALQEDRGENMALFRMAAEKK